MTPVHLDIDGPLSAARIWDEHTRHLFNFPAADALVPFPGNTVWAEPVIVFGACAQVFAELDAPLTTLATVEVAVAEPEPQPEWREPEYESRALPAIFGITTVAPI